MRRAVEHQEERRELVGRQRCRVGAASVQVVVGHGHLETDKGRSVNEEEKGPGRKLQSLMPANRSSQRILRQQRVRRFELLKLSPVVEVEEEMS